MKKILPLLVFAILFLAFSVHDVAATVYVLDQTTCTAIGGTWNFATCIISSSIRAPSGITVQIPSGVTVRFKGTVTINSADVVYNAGIINNTGNFNNAGEIYNDIPMPIQYTWNNQNYFVPAFKPGIINNMGDINNTGKIHNYGASIHNLGGLVVNSGTIENLGLMTFSNVGNGPPPANWMENAIINNTQAGTITNKVRGNINNMDGGIIDNRYGSTINNFAIIDNSGQGTGGEEYADANCGNACIGVITSKVPSVITNSGIVRQFCLARIIGSPVDNVGTGTTSYNSCITHIPEFGQMAEIILVLSIISMMMILRKSKFTHF